MTPIQTPREITLEHAERRVQMTEYFKIPNTTVTIASLHLASGFVVTGESSVVNPANFDEQRGREIARDKAMKRLIELESFLLAERRYDREQGNTASFEINLSQAQQLLAYLERCAMQGLGESARIAQREGVACAYQEEGEAVVLEAGDPATVRPPTEHLARASAQVLLEACRAADRLLALARFDNGQYEIERGEELSEMAGQVHQQLQAAIAGAGGLPAG